MAETDSNSRTTSRHRKKTHAAVQNSQTTDEPEPDSSKVVENELEEEGEDDIVHQMRCIVRKGRKLHLSDKDIQDLFLLSPVNRLVLTYFPRHFSALRKQQTRVHRALSTKTMSRKKVFWSCVCLVAVVLLFSSLPDFVDLLRESDCLLSSNHLLDEMFRPPMPCDVCRQLDSVPEVQNISRDDFRRNYAYSGVPVVVRGAARRSFANVTFQYLRQEFTSRPGLLAKMDDYCQFFPYSTDFESLADVFGMADERVELQEGQTPWYIGWSNCVTESRTVVRQMYQRPDFLPGQTTSGGVDWIFMGGPGHGAGVHIDVVHLPSWQAQLSGTKRWRLVPSYECESVCRTLHVTVTAGDVIVLDTNMWYHATEILPGPLSITIGSEYD